MGSFITVASFVIFTALVAFLTWLITRNDDHKTSKGYFLGGRSLTFPLIAGSLLLTNLSTEQMVGLNGDAYSFGLSVMVWEVVCVVALVFMAWFFLPKFLKSGVATVPEYLGIRFDDGTRLIVDIIFLFAYVLILLPVILYSGALGLMNMLDVTSVMTPIAKMINSEAVGPELQDLSRTCALWVTVAGVGILGSIYALWGGLRTVAVSDTLNGVGLLIGGFMVTYFALLALSGDQNSISAGMDQLWESQRSRFNSVGAIPQVAAAEINHSTYQTTRVDTNVPFGAIFSGIFLLNLFYWTTNQQIIQRTFAASSLAEGQKGVLLTGALKLLGPFYLVLPGMIAYSYFAGSPEPVAAGDSFGKLVNAVLPPYLTGFFAAVMVGAILSSFNSALNSTCTLFSLGFYKKFIRPNATDHQVVASGAVFGILLTICSIILAPQLAQYKSIFQYLQTMNSIYFIPIFAVVLVGMLTTRVSAIAAKVALVFSLVVLILGNFVPPFTYIVSSMHNFHFIGIVFAWTVILMLVLGEIWPRQEEFVQVQSKEVDMTAWKGSPLAGGLLIVAVVAIYACFADFGALAPKGSPLADVEVSEEVKKQIEDEYNLIEEEYKAAMNAATENYLQQASEAEEAARNRLKAIIE